jgi:hypothetical protein
MAKIKQKITNIGEDSENWKSCKLLVENVKLYSWYGKWLDGA